MFEIGDIVTATQDRVIKAEGKPDWTAFRRRRNYVVTHVNHMSGDAEEICIVDDTGSLNWYPGGFFVPFSQVPQLPPYALNGRELDKAEIYEHWIQPLLDTVEALCDVNNIAALLYLEYGEEDDGDVLPFTYVSLTDSKRDPSVELLEASLVLARSNVGSTPQ